MNQSIQQSYFGRNLQSRATNTDLKRYFRRNVAAIIEYSKIYAKRIKHRHQYQTILFPRGYEDEPSQEVSQELKNHYHKQASYPFYLSSSNLFIDNHHLKIMKKANPIALKLDILGYGKLIWFAEWLEKRQKDFLIGVTSNNWVLIISTLQKNFNKYFILDKNKRQNKEIVSLNWHKSYLFVFTENQFHILKYQGGQKQGSKLEVLVIKQFCMYKIKKGYGISVNGKFYVFAASKNKVLLLISEEGILSKINFREISFYARVDSSNILNLSLNLKEQTIIFVLSTKEEIVVMSFNVKNEMSKILLKKQNVFGLWSENYCLPYLDFIRRQSYLLVIVGLRQRLYFIRIVGEIAEISRQIKFNSKVQHVSEIGQYPGIVIVLKNSQHRKRIILTHQNKIISYSGLINIQLVDKYEISLDLEQVSQKVPSFHRTVDLYKNQELLFINSSSIERIVLSKWEEIYNQMKVTQNIQLLKYLILLQHSQSPFLKKPDSFQSLENFFPTYFPLANQILLEYYYIMNLSPQKIGIMQNPMIMIPFILQHKIRNLPDELQMEIMLWCLKKDQKLVEQMIIGGAQCGWQFAVKKGWIRAFKVMVKSGMQIQMPILKLYSMAILQCKKTVNQKSEEIQTISAPGHKYIFQLIQYVIFVFGNYMKDFEGEEKIIELKQILSLVFKDELWNFLVKFQPKSTVHLLTYLFINENCIQQINDSLTPHDVVGFNSFFKPFLKINYSHSETILSHLSYVFVQIHPELSAELIKQHAKLMLLKYYEQKYYIDSGKGKETDLNFNTVSLIYQILNKKYFDKTGFFELLKRYKRKFQSKIYFSFKKEYLKQMLKNLVKDSSILDGIYRDLGSLKLKKLLDLSQDEIEEDMNDFLAYIWTEIYLQILENLERKQPEEIRKISKEEIFSFLSDIQEENYKFQYLVVHLMLSINYLNQDYTLKIFQKYFKCSNPLVKSRIFLWLNNTLHSLPTQSNVRLNLQEQIIRKLKELIEIDKEEARMILQQFFEDRQKEIIKKIDNDPALQLQYVELIIKKGKDGEQIQSYYTNLHIKLILQLKPDELINIFNKNSEFADYNIADALILTESAQNFESKLDILIFLYEKDGQIMKCVDTYLQRLEELAFLFIETLEKSKSQSIFKDLDGNQSLSFTQALANYPPQLIGVIQEFSNKFEDSINLIYRQMQVKYQFIKKYLDKLVQILFLVLSGNYKFKNDYITFISTSIGNFIFKMLENSCLQYLSQWMIEYAGKVQLFTTLRHYFVEVFDKLVTQRVIITKIADIQRKTLVTQIKQALKTIQFSISSTPICLVCQLSFTQQNITVEALLFGCGHIYHKNCIKPIGGLDCCFYCVSKNQYKSMIDCAELNLVQLLKSYREMRKIVSSPQFNLQIKLRDTIVSLNQKRTNRLGLFDKKVSTIEAQAEIIDMKLLIQQYYTSQNKK